MVAARRLPVSRSRTLSASAPAHHELHRPHAQGEQRGQIDEHSAADQSQRQSDAFERRRRLNRDRTSCRYELQAERSQ